MTDDLVKPSFPCESALPGEDSDWFFDKSDEGDGLAIGIAVRKRLFEGRSSLSSVQVFDTVAFGKMLVIDGAIQDTDNGKYNAGLVHPVMMAHPNPKRVFIAGGAGGESAHEVLKHRSVEKVIQVEIDPLVVEHVRKHFYDPDEVALWENDPRYDLVVGDARQYLHEYAMNADNPPFDVIILDISDVFAGPAQRLFTVEFYQLCYSLLASEGALSAHLDEVWEPPYPELERKRESSTIVRTLQEVFREHAVLPGTIYMPSFGGEFGLVVASKFFEYVGTELARRSFLVGEDINKNIDERIVGGSQALRFYDEDYHRKMFAIDKRFRRRIAEETVVMRDADVCSTHD